MNVWFGVKRYEDGSERVWFTTDRAVYAVSKAALGGRPDWRFGEGALQYNRDSWVFLGHEVSGLQAYSAKPNAWHDPETDVLEKDIEPERAGATLEELFAEDEG